MYIAPILNVCKPVWLAGCVYLDISLIKLGLRETASFPTLGVKQIFLGKHFDDPYVYLPILIVQAYVASPDTSARCGDRSSEPLCYLTGG